MTKIKSINSILIANRGEIASRIIRTCKLMGIRSIAVFSEADKNSPYVDEADTAIHIGNSSPSQSYLDQSKIIAVAKKTQADAIHPGYGFLSENAVFAKSCEENGIIFIGPNSDAILAMGSKASAKILMKANDIPTIPGYEGEDQSLENLKAEAESIGFPLLIKASAGGGGRGMRIVHNISQLSSAIESAKREASNAFGDDKLILEKYINKGRHIEFQIFGDKLGNYIHLLERECSIQRRYQKIAEESPSPIMSSELRQQMGEAALKAARALKYDNAGTVEFIYDSVTQDFYFLEVNTRLQVEHPVTEMVTGLDLVKMQIESAEGQPLSIGQEDVRGCGYALELRLYAEDANKQFMPVTGKVLKWKVPSIEGLRVESAVQSGSEISIYYDPMIAKLIVHDRDRRSAIRKMKYALQHLICLGTTTNQGFLLWLMNQTDFITGVYDIHYLTERWPDKNHQTTEDVHVFLIANSLINWNKREQQRSILSNLPSGWRNNFYAYQQEKTEHKDNEYLVEYKANESGFEYIIEGQKYRVENISFSDDSLAFETDKVRHSLTFCEENSFSHFHHVEMGTLSIKQVPRFQLKQDAKQDGGYESPMPSQVLKVLVKKDQQVEKGESLIILSSMKMENIITAHSDGIIEDIFVDENSNIPSGQVLLTIKKNK